MRPAPLRCGKTNTPEFGAGSQTFNSVFGATRNPYDVTKTCGGSSGGAAVALACGMVPIADGSDTGGSLRNPAAFCNVVGLRPSPGRVPGERRQLVAAVGVGSNGAVCRRRGALSERDRRIRSGQSALDSGRRRLSFARRSTRIQGRARRLVAGPWRYSLRSGDSARRRRESTRLRGPRLHRRRGRAGLHRRGPGLPGSAVRGESPAVCAAGARTARVGQGHDQIRGRGGRTDDRRGHRARAWRGRRRCTSRAGSSSNGSTTSSFP